MPVSVGKQIRLSDGRRLDITSQQRRVEFSGTLVDDGPEVELIGRVAALKLTLSMPVQGGVCGNCGIEVIAHCGVHLIPCCPDKCPEET